MSGPHQGSGNLLADVCDGELFKSSLLFQKSEKALQIVGYYDEFTIVNPVGPRAKKHKKGMYMHIVIAIHTSWPQQRLCCDFTSYLRCCLLPAV